MARTLSFAIDGDEHAVEPVKVDRRKLYGWHEVHAYDDDGNECVLVSTDATGTVIIPKEGLALGLLAADGRWVERSELTTLGADGQAATKQPSSYSQVNELTDKASDEDLLDCSITAFYYLEDADPDLIAAIGEDIYRFDYCYLDSYEPSPAFLMVAEVGGNQELFMLVGARNNFQFIGLDEVAVADQEPDEDGDDESDEIDFSMF